MRALLAFFILLAVSAQAEPVVGENFSGETTHTLTAAVYSGCNFSQPSPVFFGGKWRHRLIDQDASTTHTFVGCNFTNARPTSGSVMYFCNTTLRRNQVRGTTDTLTFTRLDGTTFQRDVPRYRNIILGHMIRNGAGNLVASYFPSPKQINAAPPMTTLAGRRAARIRAKHEAHLEQRAAVTEANTGVED